MPAPTDLGAPASCRPRPTWDRQHLAGPAWSLSRAAEVLFGCLAFKSLLVDHLKFLRLLRRRQLLDELVKVAVQYVGQAINGLTDAVI